MGVSSAVQRLRAMCASCLHATRLHPERERAGDENDSVSAEPRRRAAVACAVLHSALMRLLIVEDDPDGREMLTELFRMHGWDVTALPTTVAAMAALRGGGFDLVISDENLEGRSGSAMLNEASAAGLLRNVGTILYTAEPGFLEVPLGCRILCKPLGLRSMLDEASAAVPEPQSRSL